MSELNSIPVISKDGVRGVLVEGVPAKADTTHALVQFESGQQVLVPMSTLTLQADGRYYYLGLRLDELEQQTNLQAVGEPYVVPVIAEELDIERHRVEIGRIRVQKRVHERTELVDEPLFRDTVSVTHVPINQVVDRPVAIRQEGDTIIVPVLEEVLVVEKRLMLKEEIHITRHTVETHEPQEVTLRREEVIVERIEPAAQPGDGKDRAE